jgi:signal transduction histidine kinase
MEIVRRAARRLARADGATFVLRDDDRCFYADEDAIGPLWKGLRFPMKACISGWAMLNRQPAIIKDIYEDARIPHAAYRPTFVRSLVMTPIRTAAPVGAIGVYWATTHEATPDEVELLRCLADSTSVAIESVDLLANLEQRVAERSGELHRRSEELEVLNRELEAFSYSVAHDLRSPLNAIDGFSQLLLESSDGQLDAANRDHLARITAAVGRMQALISDLLALSKIVLAPMSRAPLDLWAQAREISGALRAGAPARNVEVVIAEGLTAEADAGLMRIVLENLLSNAWKFTSRTAAARIEVGSHTDAAGRATYFVRDNGAGFDPQYAAKLFSPFQRLHSQSQFPGTGVGLATVQRIVHRHGGRIWAEAGVDQGACCYLTLGGGASAPPGPA